MIELVIGTTNPAKARQCELALRGEDLTLVPLADVLNEPPEVAEDAWAAEENAARKAHAYADATSQAALSLDFALFFYGAAQGAQPGVNVRRIPGAAGRATDEELISYYARLFSSLGGRVHGRWEAGAAVATPGGGLASTRVPFERVFVAKPSKVRDEGYPLASLQLAPDGRYVSELSPAEEEELTQAVLREPLRHLVATALGLTAS